MLDGNRFHPEDELNLVQLLFKIVEIALKAIYGFANVGLAFLISPVLYSWRLCIMIMPCHKWQERTTVSQYRFKSSPTEEMSCESAEAS